MYDIISMVFQVFYAAFQGYCLQYFYGSFLEYKRQNKRRNGLYAAAFYTAIRLCVNQILPFAYGDMQIIKNIFLTFGILLALACCFYKKACGITMFLAVTFMAVNQISFFLAHVMFSLGSGLFDLWIWCLKKEYISADTLEMLTVFTTIGLQILLYVVWSILCYFLLKKIVQSFREKEYAIHRTELLFILVPGMAGYLICALLRRIMLTVEDGMPELIYSKYPVMILLVPAILILCLLSILCGVRLFQDMIHLNRERNSRVILEQQVNSMQEHIAEMEHIYSGVRSMKHDMKNTLTIIMQLAAGNGTVRNPDLQSYLSELNKTFDGLEFRFQTGNTVVDTLLHMKYHEGMRAISDLRMDADKLLFPENIMIQSYDIGVILGNALDNAIEACKKQKAAEPEAETFIRLSSFLKGKMFFMEIENSFDGEVIRRQGAEFPETVKADKKVHGIGLTNIKNTAEKYHGAVDWSASRKVFTLSVMMKNERGIQNEYQ